MRRVLLSLVVVGCAPKPALVVETITVRRPRANDRLAGR